jgi:hypothetical protein
LENIIPTPPSVVGIFANVIWGEQILNEEEEKEENV